MSLLIIAPEPRVEMFMGMIPIGFFCSMLSGPLVRVSAWTTAPVSLSMVSIIVIAGCGTVTERLIDKIGRAGSAIAMLLLDHVRFGFRDGVAADTMCLGGDWGGRRVLFMDV